MTGVTNDDYESARVHSVVNYGKKRRERERARGRCLDRFSTLVAVLRPYCSFFLPSFSARRHEIPLANRDCSVSVRQIPGQCNLRSIKDALYAGRITSGRWVPASRPFRKGPRGPLQVVVAAANTDDQESDLLVHADDLFQFACRA